MIDEIMGVDYKYCPYCGQETYEQDARYCPSCGKAYPNANISPDNRNKNVYPYEVMPEECPLESRFNWGAFVFGFLWAVFNGMPWTILLWIIFGTVTVLLEDIVHSDIQIICTLVLSFIFGFWGNRWAWKYKKWKSVKQFKLVQRRWKQAGFIIVIGPFLILFIVFIIHGF